MITRNTADCYWFLRQIRSRIKKEYPQSWVLPVLTAQLRRMAMAMRDAWMKDESCR